MSNEYMAFTTAESSARMLWGDSPLPSGAMLHGTILVPSGDSGALLYLARTARFVYGYQGKLRDLNQGMVDAAIKAEKRRRAAALGEGKGNKA